MGHRLSKIYTRTGDEGQTGLGDGQRIAKDHVRIDSLGDLDELNAHIGLLLTLVSDDRITDLLLQIQHELFDLGAELCIPGHSVLKQEQVGNLERRLDGFNESLSPLKEFILPGGTQAAAQCHIARCVCRRVERRMISLNALEPVSAISLKYINRLSDLLFVLARVINMLAETSDVLWQRKES